MKEKITGTWFQRFQKKLLSVMHVFLTNLSANIIFKHIVLIKLTKCYL